MSQTATCLTFAVQRDQAAPQRFHGVAYSGGVIPQYGSFGDACIDLSSITLPEGELFALVDHDTTRRAGKFRASLSDNTVRIEGELFKSTEAGREVAELMAEGAPWQMSVGIQASINKASKANAIQLNGQTLAVDTVFSNATLREVSFVPVGADPNTTVSAFSRNLAGAVSSPEIPQPKENDMNAEDLQKQINDLSAKLEAETAARHDAETKLAEVQLAARTSAIAQLSADISRELSADETKVLQSLDEGAFATMSATLKSFKPAVSAGNAHLFSEQATDGKAENQKEVELIKARAILMNQVSGKAA